MADTVAGSLRQRAASGGKWTATSAVVAVSIQLLQLGLLGRLLNPTDFGLMAMMLVVLGLATSIADFGVGNYLVQAENLSRQLIRQFFFLATTLATLLALVVALLANPVATYYHSPQLSNLLPWFALVIVVTTVSQIQVSVLQRSFQFKSIAITEIVCSFATLLVTVALASAGYGVWSLIVGQISSGVCKVSFLYRGTHRALDHLPKSCQARFVDATHFGCFHVGERLVNFLSSNVDKVIIGHLLGPALLGQYSVAYQLMLRPISVINPIVTRVSLPIFSEIKHDNGRLCSGYLQILKMLALFTFPIYLGLAIGSDAVVSLLIGSQWSNAGPAFSILCISGMLISIGNPTGTLILAKNKPAWGFYVNFIALFVYGFAFWLGSAYGLEGVALALLLSKVALLSTLDVYLRWKLVGMTIGAYLYAMRHLFIAVAIPLGFYKVLQINELVARGSLLQLVYGMVGVLFFCAYLWIFEQPHLKSTYKLMRKGV